MDEAVEKTIELQHAVMYDRVRNQLSAMVRRRLDHHPEFPSSSLALVRVRYKGFKRMLEKLRQVERDGVVVTSENYHTHIVDLLGIRYVTLLPSHKAPIVEFIRRQKESGVLQIANAKDVRSFEKQSFDPNDPEATTTLNPQGYSSMHYTVQLTDEEAKLHEMDAYVTEVQIRSIFEESWSEIDHKYRYELERQGVQVSDDLANRFANLSHYLLSVARHAENLCAAAVREADNLNVSIGELSTSHPEFARSATRATQIERQRSLDEVIVESIKVELEADQMLALDNGLRALEIKISGIPTLFSQYKAEFVDSWERGTGRSDAPPFDGNGDVVKELLLFFSYAAAFDRAGQNVADVILRRGLDGMAE